MKEKSLTYRFELDGSTTVIPEGDCRAEDMVTVVFHTISYLAELENMTTVQMLEQMLKTHIEFEEEK